MWEEPRWKLFCMYKGGLFIAKGKTDPCGYSIFLMTIWLLFPLNFTQLSIWQVGILDIHVTLHWSTIWPTLVMWMTWLMTILDMTVLLHLCCYWFACWATGLLGEGCPYGVSWLHLCMERWAESSMVIGFVWCWIRTLLLACTLAYLRCLFVHKKCMFIHPFIREHIFTCSSICLFTNTSLHRRPFLNTSCWLRGSWPRFRVSCAKQNPTLLALLASIHVLWTEVSLEAVWWDVGTKFPHLEVSVMSFCALDLPLCKSISR